MHGMYGRSGSRGLGGWGWGVGVGDSLTFSGTPNLLKEGIKMDRPFKMGKGSYKMEGAAN